MTDHTLLRIEREEGQKEVRFRFVCSCGVLGPDHGALTTGVPDRLTARESAAHRKAERDHKLHAQGLPTGQVEDERDLPGRPYSPPDEEGR